MKLAARCKEEGGTGQDMNSGAGVNNCFMVLGWTPEDGGVGGRPKTTWGRTVKRERGKAGWKSWNVAKMVACDRGVGQTM